MSKSEKLMMVVVRGGFQPADSYTSKKLRERNYEIGEIVAGQITKPRNPKFWRMAHALGNLVAENIEGFEGMEAHKVIKRLQREAMLECEEFAFKVAGFGIVTQYIPRSLSFESMGEEVFSKFYSQMCQYIIKTYWPSETTESIERMAEMMSTA